MYADDTAVLSAAKQSNTIIKTLNFSLATLHRYFHKWKIKINANKTQAILFPFNNQRKRIPTSKLMNQSHIVQLSKSVKYLGITFASKLTFGEHIANTINKATKCFRALHPMLAHTSQLTTENKILIYKSVVRPIMSYGCPIWSTAAHTHTKQFTTLQNKILKSIFNLHRRTPTAFIEKITNICRFDNNHIDSLNTQFSGNCEISDYNLIREIDLL